MKAFTAGFQFNIALPALPQAVEDTGSEAVYDPNHSATMSALERYLRQLVEQKLAALDGSAWVQRRVPQEVRGKWANRRAEDRDTGGPVYDLIH